MVDNENIVKSFRPSVLRIIFPLAATYAGASQWNPARYGSDGRIVLTGDGQDDEGTNMGWDGMLDEHLTSLQSDGVPSTTDDDFVVEDIGFQPVGGAYFSLAAATGGAGAQLVAIPSASGNAERGEAGFLALRDQLVQSYARTTLLGFKDRKSSKCEVTLGAMLQYASGVGAYGVDKQGTISVPTTASRAGQIADAVAGLRLPAKAIKDRIGFYLESAQIPKLVDTEDHSGTASDHHPVSGAALVVPMLCTIRGHYEAPETSSMADAVAKG